MKTLCVKCILYADLPDNEPEETFRAWLTQTLNDNDISILYEQSWFNEPAEDE